MLTVDVWLMKADRLDRVRTVSILVTVRLKKRLS